MGFIEEFDWDNATMGTILDLCLKCETEEDAKLVMEAYKKINPEHWAENLGYSFGYCGPEDRERLYKLFPVNHPVFGSGFGRGNEPTQHEAFAEGLRLGKEARGR